MITPIIFVDANTLNVKYNMTVNEFKCMHDMKRVRTINIKEHYAVQDGDIKLIQKKIITKIDVKKFPRGIIQKKTHAQHKTSKKDARLQSS